MYAWGLSRTDRIFVQHDGQLSDLSPRLRSKARILPKVYIPEVDGQNHTLKPHNVREKYVAWVGTLINLKRPDVLIEIARKTPSIQFVVCGGLPNGGEKEIVQQLQTTPNVKYLGQVPPQKAQEIIADASVLLSTSDVEGFPNTFAQAWFAGTPVISLKVDPGHLIAEKGLGVVSGTPERAAAEIKKLIDLPDHRQEIAIRARQHMNENNSAEAVVNLFQDALKNR